MCLILLALDAHPAYKLILAANRDEFYERPTAPLAFWEDAPAVLAGRDLRSGGTWLGITKTGRIAAVTNYRDPTSEKPHAPSRGDLVKNFLLGRERPRDYVSRLSTGSSRHNGFNLLVGTVDQVFWYSNRGEGVQQLHSGIHGISNHLLNTPWPKVSRGVEAMKQILADADTAIEPMQAALFDLLTDRSIPEDHLLPETGVGLEWERILSPLFITSPEYGTRSSTLLLIDHQRRTTVIERTHTPGAASAREITFAFGFDAHTSP
ncbi:MAG: NRDE family protein [Deltaproteobacteria bacterium]|jgi:uncharacterized protein with NRDE domain